MLLFHLFEPLHLGLCYSSVVMPPSFVESFGNVVFTLCHTHPIGLPFLKNRILLLVAEPTFHVLLLASEASHTNFFPK
jgi:hypothetical protein